MPIEFHGFGPDALRYLRALRRNNRREWFLEHRTRYEEHVRAPMGALIEEMDVRFARFAPEITGDPKRSAFRIHRDVRFSADKSPYKTHAASWFFHRDAGKGVGGGTPHGGAGFYFHLEPNASSIGGGLWMPPSDAVRRVRQALDADHESFARIVKSRALTSRFGGLDEEAMLRRVPRGFSPEHPGAEWLRHRSYTMGRILTNDEALGDRLADLLEREFRALLPLVRWLNSALGFPPASRR